MGTRTSKGVPPVWAVDGTRLVACVDGPMQNQWFTATDWRERVEAAKRMRTLGQRRPVCLDYEADGVTTHPQWEIATAVAMYHRPATRRR